MINFKNTPLLFSNLSAFFFFALFLSVKSAYSWAIGLTLLTAIISTKNIINQKLDQKTIVLGVFFLLTGVVWSHTFDGWFTWSTEGDYFAKYALGAFCTIALCSTTIQPRFLIYGLSIGCLSAATLAMLQFPESGRAAGYTNAIRFGNIAILMGFSCWIFSCTKSIKIQERLWLLLAGSLGILASFLSLSRGGWLLFLALPFFAAFIAKKYIQNHRKKILFISILALAAGILAIQNTPILRDRVLLVQKEVQGYFQHKDVYATSSVGARLEQWHLAWNLGWEKPFTGWGDQGIHLAKEQYVEAQKAHPSIFEIHHSHNDLLEMWARRGIFGVVFILGIYLIPILVFFPTQKSISRIQQEKKSEYIALHLIGLLLPTGYFIFGLTDVFFNLSIGHHFYIFAQIFILAAIQGMQQSFPAPHIKLSHP